MSSGLDRWLMECMGRDSLPTPGEIRGWQLTRLRRVVDLARMASPFYRERLAGVEVDALVTPEDFARLPRITPAELSETPERMLCVSQDDIARVVTLRSSGTTGSPKRIFLQPGDLEATRAFFARGMTSMVNPGESVLVFLPGTRPGGVAALLCEALDRMGARGVPHGFFEDADRAVDQILEADARCLVGTPAQLNMLALAWGTRNLPTDRVRSALLCWDTVPEPIVRNVETAMGCRVFHHWGMVETGLGGGVDCPLHHGMHLREADVYLEIADPDTGELLPDGEPGEMVVSMVRRTGMPLIRYRTGDRGRILPGQCACGSPLRRLDPQVTRMVDGVALGRGNLTMDLLNGALYALPGLADFAVWLLDGTLVVRGCGVDPDLKTKMYEALAAIPVVGQSVASGALHIDVHIREGAVPAVPGLGKRRIRTNREYLDA